MKSNIIFYSIIFLLLVSHQSYSQDAVRLKLQQDSLLHAPDDTSRINALRKIGNLYKMVKTDSGIYFTRMALALAEKINWTKGIAQNCLNLGSSFIDISKYDSSIFYSAKALDAAKIVGDKNRIALIYINRGAAYTETQQYEKALPDLKEAMRLGEEIGSIDRQERAAQGICELYTYQENYNAASPWCEKALQLAQELGNEGFQGTAEMSLAGIYFEKKDLKKAELLLLDAIPKSKSANKTDVVISATITLGEIYNATHQYEKALAILKEGLADAKKVEEADQVASVYNSIGDTYLNLKEYQEAKTAFSQGYEAVKGRTEFQQRQYGDLEGLAKTYSALGDFKTAYETSKLAAALKDSSMQKSQNNKLLEMQAKFETEQKEKQIILLTKDQQLNKLNQQKQKAFQVAGIIIMLLLIVMGAVIINRYRVIQRIKRKVEVEQVRNNIARSLHDDIGSTLTSINILSKVALQQAETNTSPNQNIQKIKDRSLAIMESMSDIVWSVNPMNDSLDRIIIRMKEFASELCEQSGIAFSFKEEGDLNNLKLSLKQRSDLYLIFKEAINNAVKYSNAATIEACLEKKPNSLYLHIKDDGKGFNVGSQFAGNGLKNMSKRAEEINAVYKINSLAGSGTEVTLDIPVT